MARSSGRRSAPARSSAPPRRSAHTAAAPAAPRQQPVQAATQPQQRSPGLFGTMASVAAGSSIGHVIGHGITGMFGGNREVDYAEQPVAQAQQNQEQAQHCDGAAMNFTRCLEENGGNMQICDYYLQQLKACQQAAAQY
ncbi:hypothetical protein BABINDRAFT_158899 [Babjeviella inositovora NRRL Y-12698]|uniref:CHCH domain-containing protein n=1 Tax=Babjeviella inositovora NRRL Y-12698 TaxID=984486 RepID=A0A1E3QX50_9ASCO|nr:uncharacterized protein BABINDRAFT_158899 [Babjeviella inositovora NRRL Y-12698]ODQ82268.1 hypothetical protein BABINDRAFT_158899 [Babjeviella inositovora NRRL Y-12698]